MWRKWALWGLLGVFAGGTAACGSHATTAGAPAGGVATTPPAVQSGSAAALASGPPAGYQQVVDQVHGYVLAVPANWQQLKLDAPNVTAAVSQLLAQNPQLASRIGTSPQALVQAGVQFLAVGPDGSDVNMVVRDASNLPAGAPGSLLSSLRDQLAAAGGTLRASDDESINGTPALHLAITLQIGGRPVTSDQYYLVSAGRMIVATIRAPTATVAAIAGTLRFVS